MAVDNALIESLSKSGPAAKVNIVADSGKAYAMNFSLKGFAAAHDDMVSQARAKAKPVAKPGDAAPAPRRDAVAESYSNEKGRSSDAGLFCFRLGLNVIATPFMQ